MNSPASRRVFLSQVSASAALLGGLCPLAAQTPAPGPGAESPKPPSDDVARLRRQLDAQREGSLRLLIALHEKHGAPITETIGAFTASRAQAQYAKRRIAGERNLQALKAELWDKLPPAFQWELLEQTPERMKFKVSGCPAVAEMKRFEVPAALGFALNCASDPGIAAGINPAIRFSRTQTLMEGHPCCDHCYELKPSNA